MDTNDIKKLEKISLELLALSNKYSGQVKSGKPLKDDINPFESCWFVYPHYLNRSSKKISKAAFMANVRKDKEAAGKIYSAAHKYRALVLSGKEDQQFVPAMERWLKSEKWDNWTDQLDNIEMEKERIRKQKQDARRAQELLEPEMKPEEKTLRLRQIKELTKGIAKEL